MITITNTPCAEEDPGIKYEDIPFGEHFVFGYTRNEAGASNTVFIRLPCGGCVCLSGKNTTLWTKSSFPSTTKFWLVNGTLTWHFRDRS